VGGGLADIPDQKTGSEKFVAPCAAYAIVGVPPSSSTPPNKLTKPLNAMCPDW